MFLKKPYKIDTIDFPIDVFAFKIVVKNIYISTSLIA